MLTTTQNIFQAKDLLLQWTVRNIRARYQQSALGWFWAVIQPAAQALIFTVVFTLIVPIDTGDVPYVLFAYVAIVPWTLLAMSLPDMSNSLVENMSLVTKIYFPREVLPIAAMLARLMDFGVAAILIAILMIIFKAPVFPLGWLFLPVVLGIQMLLIVGLGLALSALNVFYRDVRSLLVLGLQVWFYASPIIYPISLVPDWLLPYYYLNPMAGIITAYRDILLYQRLPGSYLAVAGVLSLAIFIFGYWFFKRVEFQFADIV
ncbi:MAG: ABC transporter permease [Anaerolineae bacterium]|nr:ABC transporter permease [Anaerolineae bacterium]